jgi:hypothetical protein
MARLVRSIPRDGDSDNIGLSRTLRVFEQDGEHDLGFLTVGSARAFGSPPGPLLAAHLPAP